jgi:hypothetical protein
VRGADAEEKHPGDASCVCVTAASGCLQGIRQQDLSRSCRSNPSVSAKFEILKALYDGLSGFLFV